ncbi:MAG: SUMF1/EgtB/PvdO family nonheme iron enzyme [Calditrichaeota bacterium]|nr:SUMF1/EgtB/PvdO family nonheme iron enzyme [Calditrichota bacterium]MCB9473395.1 SUMF1/EgtB/PvdO family nonheme iron enzyme [Candidatus Delongbacteria bacterium]
MDHRRSCSWLLAGLLLGAVPLWALEVLELDDHSVVLYGHELQATDGVELLRVSNLGDSLWLYLDGLKAWVVDGDLQPETTYAWSWRAGERTGHLDGMRKHTVVRPLGLLFLNGFNGGHALVYTLAETGCGEYMDYCALTGWPVPPEQNFPRMRNYLQFFRSYPLVNVDDADARAYCNWLSGQDGLPPAYNADGLDMESVGWRLPTVREMYWLADLQRDPPHWASEDVPQTPIPHRESSSADGPQNVTGNVWEWCENGFGHAPASGSPGRSAYFDPAGRDSRLVFGGSYNNTEAELSSLVTAQDPGARLSTLGFRTVRWLLPESARRTDEILAQNPSHEIGKDTR